MSPDEPTVDEAATVVVPSVDEVAVKEPSAVTEEAVVTDEPPVAEAPLVDQAILDEPVDAPAKQSLLRGSVEWAVILGVALIAAVVIRQFLLQAFYIPSGSMEHTLEIRDRVLVNKLSYRLHKVHRGDILVFERPADDGSGSKDLIKRVVALPGETVEGRDGAVFINGQLLNEPYLARGVTSGSFPAQRVPPAHVWMMGDNRSNSRDSRVIGAIPESKVVGRAFIRVFPLDSISLL